MTMRLGTAQVIQGNALNLPLPDASVDLICTSPPYFGLRSYQDGCPDCSDTSKANTRGYMERYCPGCNQVRNRNVCPQCGLTTLRTEATKQALRRTDCATCGGTGKGHYDGQIGSEATPAEFLEALLAATREMVRVLKPSGSLFINLGDKYSTYEAREPSNRTKPEDALRVERSQERARYVRSAPTVYGVPYKSLMGIPWRYAIACIDTTRGVPVHIVREMVAAVYNGNLDPRACDEILKEYEAGGRNAGLGLILRAEIIWSKPNGLPESVTDRVRRSHEQWFHMVKQPRYFSAVDEIREEHAATPRQPGMSPKIAAAIARGDSESSWQAWTNDAAKTQNPLGKLPGSVWTIPTQPLTVPPELGVDHFAAYPMEWPRRIIQGWTPNGICTQCDEGRRPTVNKTLEVRQRHLTDKQERNPDNTRAVVPIGGATLATITGYICGCPTPNAPTTPSIILDPFGGTGTTALVAKALGRIGITIDLSADYCRLAEWRCNDPGQLAQALQIEKPEPISPDQLSLFGEPA